MFGHNGILLLRVVLSWGKLFEFNGSKIDKNELINVKREYFHRRGRNGKSQWNMEVFEG